MPVTRTLFLVTISNAYWFRYQPLCRLKKQENLQLQIDIKISSHFKLVCVQFFSLQSQSWLWKQRLFSGNLPGMF